MRRALLAAVVTAALHVPAASAHVVPRPQDIESGTTQRIVLEVPNERDGHETVEVRLGVPEHLVITGAAAPDGWTVSHDATSATWTGGSLAGQAVAELPVDLAASGPSRERSLDVRQFYEDGKEEAWAPTLTVLPAVAAAPSEHLGRALVASLVGIVLVGGSLVALQRLRRRPRDDAP